MSFAEDDRRQAGHSTAPANTRRPEPADHSAGPGSGTEETAAKDGDERDREEPEKPGGGEKIEAGELALHPSSQEELRERRLKYLDQKKPPTD